jgi:hypothetical protein
MRSPSSGPGRRTNWAIVSGQPMWTPFTISGLANDPQSAPTKHSTGITRGTATAGRRPTDTSDGGDLAAHGFDKRGSIASADVEADVAAAPPPDVLGGDRAVVPLGVNDVHPGGANGQMVDVGLGSWDAPVVEDGDPVTLDGVQTGPHHAFAFRSDGPRGGRLRLVRQRQDDAADAGMGCPHQSRPTVSAVLVNPLSGAARGVRHRIHRLLWVGSARAVARPGVDWRRWAARPRSTGLRAECRCGVRQVGHRGDLAGRTGDGPCDAVPPRRCARRQVDATFLAPSVVAEGDEARAHRGHATTIDRALADPEPRPAIASRHRWVAVGGRPGSSRLGRVASPLTTVPGPAGRRVGAKTTAVEAELETRAMVPRSLGSASRDLTSEASNEAIVVRLDTWRHLHQPRLQGLCRCPHNCTGGAPAHLRAVRARDGRMTIGGMVWPGGPPTGPGPLEATAGKGQASAGLAPPIYRRQSWRRPSSARGNR